MTFRRLPDDWSIIHTYTQECLFNIQPVRQCYYTHTDAICCRLGNNNTESAWQSADGRVTSDHCRWLFSDCFQEISEFLGTSKKSSLTVGQRSRDLQPLSHDYSATFFKIFPNCWKRPKNVVWQSADGRVTSNHSRVTVQWLFQNFSQLLETSKKRYLTVSRRSRDLRLLSRDR